MYIIESKNQKQNFFYCIKLQEKNALLHLDRLRANNCIKTELKQIEIDKYPLYVIEQNNEFVYFTQQNILQMLNKIVDNQEYLSFDEDFVLFNIYIITSEIEFDFDYLGYIDHIHADKHFFERYVKYGEKVIR